MVGAHEYRLRKLKEKQDRKKPAADRPGQVSIRQAETLALDQRIKSGRFGLLREEEREPEEEPPIPIEDIPRRQVSFIVQKKCSCGAINKYIATDCRKCGGHLCYDKTPGGKA